MRNSMIMIGSRFAGMAAMVITVPVIIGCLGNEAYGVWESMLAVAGMSIVFHTTISGTLIWRISNSFGDGQTEEIYRAVRLGIGIAILLTVTCLVPLVFYRGDILSHLQTPKRWMEDGTHVLPILGAVMLLSCVNQVFLSVITGCQRAGLASVIQSLGLVANCVTSIVLIRYGFGLAGLLTGYLVGFLGVLCISYYFASLLVGRPPLMPTWPRRDEINLLGPFAALLLVSNLTFIFRDQLDKVLLSSLGSPTITGEFAMAQRLTMLVTQVFAVIFIPFTSMVGSLHSNNDWTAIRILYSRISMIMGSVVGLAGFLLVTLRTPIFVLWLGEDQRGAHVFLALLVFAATSAIMFAGAGVALVKGIGRPGLETTYTLVTLALVVISKPILIRALGPVGSVTSSTLSWCVGAVFFMLLLHRSVSLPRHTATRTVGLFVVTLTLSVIGWCVTTMFPVLPSNRLEAAIVILVMGAVLAAIYCFALYASGLFPAKDVREIGRKPAQHEFERRERDEITCPDIAA